MEEKNSVKKTIKNLIFFSIIFAITIVIILKEQNITDILNIIKNVKIKYVIIGIISMFIYLLFETINLNRTLKSLGEKVTFMQNFKYVVIGFFFSSITPAASGGQPAQIYYMNKNNISVGNSTLALLINLTSMQIITLSLGIISFIINYNYLNTILIICFIIGIALNMSALILLLISIFSKRLSNWFIKIALKILKILRVKNIDAKKEFLEYELTKYQENAIYIKKNSVLIIKTIITTLIQFIVYYSISYWTYKALGFYEKNIFEIITMQSVLFATVSGMPSPGAVGVSEGAFIEIFKNVYPSNVLNSATLLNRGMNFYIFLIISAIVVVINDLRCRRKGISGGNIK